MLLLGPFGGSIEENFNAVQLLQVYFYIYKYIMFMNRLFGGLYLCKGFGREKRSWRFIKIVIDMDVEFVASEPFGGSRK